MGDEFNHPTRGLHYRVANETMSLVRRAEIDATVALLDPRRDERILDFGAGNGIMSVEISGLVGSSGRVDVVDVSSEVLGKLATDSKESNLHVTLFDGGQIPFDDAQFNAAVSLANFHHVSDKASSLHEFARVLKPGGRLVIADVAAQTPVQRYFDEHVDRVCSTGHQHEFMDERGLVALTREAGFGETSWSIREVPWRFDSKTAAGWFLKMIHDAQCSEKECYDAASHYLGFRSAADGIELNWQLFFFVAEW